MNVIKQDKHKVFKGFIEPNTEDEIVTLKNYIDDNEIKDYKAIELAQKADLMDAYEYAYKMCIRDRAYNLILLGPPGVGKTMLSIGLGIEAINRGYRVSFVQMDELIRLLKTEEISRNSKAKVKRMVGSDLVIIDDLMFMAIDRHEANLFFQLIRCV